MQHILPLITKKADFSRKHITLVLTLVLVVFALLSFGNRNAHLIGPPIGKILGQDFRQILEGSRSIQAGHGLYDRALSFGYAPSFKTFMNWTASPYPYSPLPAILALPLLAVPTETALEIWTGVNLALLVLSAVMAVWSFAGEEQRRQLPPYLLVLTLFFIFEPVHLGMMLVQIDILILFLLVLSYFLYARGSRLAGLPLGLAVAIKPILAPLACFYLFRRQWRAVLLAAGTALLLTALSFTIAGWRLFPQYLEVNRLWSSMDMLSYSFNQSTYGVALRFFTENAYIEPLVVIPWLARALQILSFVLGVAAFIAVMRAQARPDRAVDGVTFGFALLCNLLMSPLVEDNHFIWVLIPLSALLLSSIAIYQEKGFVVPLAGALLLALYLSFPDLRDATYVGSGPLRESGILVERKWLVFTGAYFYGFIALCGFTFFFLKQRKLWS